MREERSEGGKEWEGKSEEGKGMPGECAHLPGWQQNGAT